ncbi:MAG TPA: sporulation protein YqfD, partial [Bacillota bacterium]|nr:sporulation protein YqfD [Bacillota bacterium]
QASFLQNPESDPRPSFDMSQWSEGTEKLLAVKVPGIAWAGLEMEGTRVRVKVVEKVLPPPRISLKPADVVAKREGLINQVLVMAGEAVVKPGDMVKRGQILISGNVHTPERPGGVDTIETEEGMPMPVLPRQVSARGIVRARTWHKGYGEAQIVEQGYRPSGAKANSIGIKWSTGEIIIKGPKTSPYPHARRVSTRKNLSLWRNYRFPVELVTTEFVEMCPYTLDRGVEGARALARQQAIAQLVRIAGPKAQVLKEQIEETGDPEDNLIQMGITWETMEDIGQIKYWE